MATPRLRIRSIGEGGVLPPTHSPTAPRSSSALRLLEAESSADVISMLLHEISGMGFERVFIARANLESGWLEPVEALACSRAYLDRFRVSIYAPGNPMVEALHRQQPATLSDASLHHRSLYVHPLLFTSPSTCWEASQTGKRDCLAHENSVIARRVSFDEQHCSTCKMRGYALLACVELPRPNTDVRKLGELVSMANRFLARLFKIEHYYNRMAEMGTSIRQMETVMQSMSDPVVLTDPRYRVLLHNRAAERFFRLPEQASQGLVRAVELNNLLFSAALSSMNVAGDHSSRDLTLVDAVEGEELLFEAITSPIYSGDGKPEGFVTVMRNVTDLRRADEELRSNYQKLADAEQRLRLDRDRLNLIIENVGDPIIVCDGTAKPVLMDPRAQQLLGTEDLGGRLRMRNHARLDAWISNFTFSFLDRSTTNLKLVNPAVEEETEYEARSGKIYDERGQVAFTVTVLRDLTAWRKVEQLSTERKMLQMEKFAAAGRLAATLAHEVNNPLESIKNCIWVLGDMIQPEGDKFFRVLQSETDRVARIVRQMLGLYRGTERLRPENVNTLLEDSLALLERQLQRAGVQVEFELRPLPPAIVAPDQLRQVFSNLLINARDSMPNGGRLLVRTCRVSGTSGACICVTIADTGTGIRRELRETIFEPFVTTKGDRGTGLGLWIVKSIITDHSGKVTIRSKPGQGTVFRLTFPVER